MAKQNKKKQKRFQFELGIPGLIFVTGLLICLFLWMFILGFWLGQKIMTSKVQHTGSPIAQKMLQQKKETPPLVTEEVRPPALEPEKDLAEAKKPTPLPASNPPQEQPPKELPPAKNLSLQQTMQDKGPKISKKEAKIIQTSPAKVKTKTKSPTQKVYSLQVASFRSPQEAQKYVRFLSRKGYEAFVRKVNLPQKGQWYRVYIGRFSNLKQAKNFGQQLQQKEKIKTYYITRIEVKP